MFEKKDEKKVSNRNVRIVERLCPNCHHNYAWGPRGEESPQYKWKCSKCGYSLKADKPPEKCPSCKEKCEFVDVSCYIPECGQQGSDQRLR